MNVSPLFTHASHVALQDAKKQQAIAKNDLKKMVAAKDDLFATLKKLGKHGLTPMQKAGLLKRADSDRKAINKYDAGVNAAAAKAKREADVAQKDADLAKNSAPKGKDHHGKPHEHTQDGKPNVQESHYAGGNPHPKLPDKMAHGLVKANNVSSDQNGIFNDKHNDQILSNKNGSVGVYKGTNHSGIGAEVTKKGDIAITKNNGHSWKTVGNVNKGDDIYKKTKGTIGDTAARDLKTFVTKDHGDLGKYAKDPEAVSGGSASTPKPKPKPSKDNRPPAAKVNAAVDGVNKSFYFADGKANEAGAKLEKDYAKGANKSQLMSDWNNYVKVINHEHHTYHHGLYTHTLRDKGTPKALEHLKSELGL